MMDSQEIFDRIYEAVVREYRARMGHTCDEGHDACQACDAGWFEANYPAPRDQSAD